MGYHSTYSIAASLPKTGPSIGQSDSLDHGRKGGYQGQLIDNQEETAYLTTTDELLLQKTTRTTTTITTTTPTTIATITVMHTNR